jgi:hypothetical protein
MAKSTVKKTSPTDKKIAALNKRMKALENQSFAQKLLIDDLESKLEQADSAIKRLNEPIQHPFQWQTNIPSPQAHSCQGGYPDVFGSVTCMTCGKLLYTVTATVGTVTSTGRVSLPETMPLPLLPDEDIEILWTEPWTISDNKTKE